MADTIKWEGSNVPSDEWGFIEPRDAAHNAGFLALAHYYSGNTDLADKIMEPVKDILLKPWLFPYKHPTYKWSNCEDWRKTAYNIFLSKLGVDPFCGMNGDQTMPVNCFYAEKRNLKQHLRFLAGFPFRLFFYPNLGDNLLLKLDHLSPIFRAYRYSRWLCWLTDSFFYLGSLFTVKRPISEETTNKIRMFLFLVNATRFGHTIWTKKVLRLIETKLGAEDVEDINGYFKKAFQTYWHSGPKMEIWEKMPFGLLRKA